MRLFLLVFAVALARGDDQTRKMTARVSEEADAFQKLAPQVLGSEKLHQRAQKPASRFRLRVGDAAKGPPQPVWKEQDIVSEYAFSSFAGEAGSLHEFRQVVSVDKRKVSDSKNAEAALAKIITADDDTRKKELLKQFEKYGLVGAVTDFGELILLFTRREIERYEFTNTGSRMLENQPVLVFSYKQLDGPEALTLIEANRGDQTRHLLAEGEIWVRPDTYVPVRITMNVRQGEGASMVREEATVDYAMSRFGALLPVKTSHRELRGGNVVAENQFTYTDFRKFDASSDIKFKVDQ